MNGDWQSWAALAVVILTALVFIAKRFTKKSSGSCGSADCNCGPKKQHGRPRV